MKALRAPLALLARLFGRPLAAAAAAPAQPRPLLVLVAALPGDAEGETAGRLLQALGGRKGLLTRQLPPERTPPALPTSAAALAAAHAWARQVLFDEAGDLLLWGGQAGRNLVLHATPRPGERPHLPVPPLEIPASIEGPLADAVHAAVLATVEPVGEVQRGSLAELLPDAAQTLDGVVRKPPNGLSPRQHASLLLSMARLALALASAQPAADWLERAEAALEAAAKRLQPRDRQALDEPLLARLAAEVKVARAERAQGEAEHEQAIAACRAALAVLPREAFPLEWAAEQARLGVALYRFDLRSGRTDLLKEAVNCLQSALQVVGRHEDPRRWAELTMDLAQVLQVYGDAVRSVDVLDRAVAACRAVLELRPRDGDPVGWAAAMHTLGTALFLRDKHDDSSGHLDEAADILRQAAEACRALGLDRMAALSEKNIGHVERLAKARQERRARFDWAQIPDDED